MKKDVPVRKFFRQHRHRMPEDEFVLTLMRKLDAMPTPSITAVCGSTIFRWSRVFACMPLVLAVVAILVVYFILGNRSILNVDAAFIFYGIDVWKILLCAACTTLLTLTAISTTADGEKVEFAI